MSLDIICTICERDYAYGLGALLNSIINSGFKGKIIVGIRDELPFWTNQLVPNGENSYYLDHIEIEFVKCEWEDHLSYYKPFLIKNIYERYNDSKIFYFDPDITIIADWNFYRDWSDCGVPLCVDQSYTLLGYLHPWVKKWEQIFEIDLTCDSRSLNPYVNSGYLSIKNSEIELIDLWISLTKKLKTLGHDLKNFGVTKKIYQLSRRANPILTDQDIFNAAILNLKNLPISIIGQEAMGFIPGGYIMLHNTGIKAWNKNFLYIFIKNGAKIGQADESFLKYCTGPIKLYSKMRLRFKTTNLKATKILQRLF